MGIHIITDTSSDLDLTYAKEHQDVLTVLGMPIELNGEGYVDDLGDTFSKDFFYEALESGAFPSTSQISPTVYLNAFEAVLEKGDRAIVIGLSSGLSSTINSAQLAAEQFNATHGNQVQVIDYVAASVGLGFFVERIIEAVESGISYEDLVTWIEDKKLMVNHWFAIDDLLHLKKGGRIPPTMAYVGTMLKVKPILTVSHTGKLGSHSKVRGRGKSIQFLLSKLDEHIGQDHKGHLVIGHADDLVDANKLLEKIQDKYPELEVKINCLCPTIATHVGPGMLAIAFFGDQIREDIDS